MLLDGRDIFGFVNLIYKNEMQIITDVPQSGGYEEIQYGDGNNLLWVRFIDEKGEWYGKFPKGDFGGTDLIQIDEQRIALLSNGDFYLLNHINKELEGVLLDKNLYNIIYCNETNEIVLADNTRLHILDMKANILHASKRISLDGIRYDGISDGVINGESQNLDGSGADGWRRFRFTYNVKSRKHWGEEGYDAYLFD